MCGIVGLFCKSPELEPWLGALLSAMLVQMSDRGPDSAGVAVYRHPAPDGWSKLTLYSADAATDWGAVAGSLAEAFGGAEHVEDRARHAVVLVDADADEAEAWIRANRPELRVMSAGRVIEIYKEVGLRAASPTRSRLPTSTDARPRPHAHGDREPDDDRGRPDPFLDNGHDALPVERLFNSDTSCGERARRGRRLFETENDTEVAAGYLTWRLREGASLQQALEGCLDDLDGFYTFLVGTADGFAILRDPIACKPAVLAETDDWVAMASEFRAIAVLPGANDARIWEARAVGRLRVGEGARVTAVDVAAEVVDLAATSLRELNERLHDLAGATRSRRVEGDNPNGMHNVAVGLDAPVDVEIAGTPATSSPG